MYYEYIQKQHKNMIINMYHVCKNQSTFSSQKVVRGKKRIIENLIHFLPHSAPKIYYL